METTKQKELKFYVYRIKDFKVVARCESWAVAVEHLKILQRALRYTEFDNYWIERNIIGTESEWQMWKMLSQMENMETTKQKELKFLVYRTSDLAIVTRTSSLADAYQNLVIFVRALNIMESTDNYWVEENKFETEEEWKMWKMLSRPIK